MALGEPFAETGINLTRMLQPIKVGPRNLHSVMEVVAQANKAEGKGLMLYYGDTKAKTKAAVSARELSHTEDLLWHIIAGLSVLQHDGSLIVKIYTTQHLVTAGIVFLMYYLFRSVSIIKPYTVNGLSQRQYLVCKGIKQRRPSQFLTGLIKMFHHLSVSKDLNFLQCQGLLRLLEDEHTLMTFLKNHNKQLLSHAMQVTQAATNRQESTPLECFQLKQELLTRWGIPVKQQAPNQQRNSSSNRDSSKRRSNWEDKFAQMGEQQLQETITGGRDVLANLDHSDEDRREQERRRRHQKKKLREKAELRRRQEEEERAR